MKLTYTQIGTLLHAALDVCPNEEDKEKLINYDKEMQANKATERSRLENIAQFLSQGIEYDWSFEEEVDETESYMELLRRP